MTSLVTPHQPLTTKGIEALPATGAAYFVRDLATAGLRLRVSARGEKSWQVDVRSGGSRSTRTLGKYPAVGLKEARALSAIQRSEASTQRRDSPKLAAVVDEWAVVTLHDRTPAYREDALNSLKNHALKKLGDWPIRDVTTAIVRTEVLAPLIAAGKLEMAGRVHARLRSIFDFAVAAQYIESHQIAALKTVIPRHKVTHYPTIRPEELSTFLKAFIFQSRLEPLTVKLFLFQLHTLTRPSEAAGAGWGEIQGDCWTIPASRMKAGKQHSIPLTQSVSRLLADIRLITGPDGQYVFPARSNDGPRNAGSLNVAIGRTPGFDKRLVAHGLRSLGATALIDLGGFSPDLVDAALAHVKTPGASAAFASYYRDRVSRYEERKPLMQWWSNFIDDALTKALSV